MEKYLPIVHAGILDSLNPGSLTGSLLFVILMLGWPKKWMRCFLGFLFIWSLVVPALSISLGNYDSWLMKEWVDSFWDIGYFVVIILLALAGGVLFRDWWISRREGSDWQPWLSFQSRVEDSRPFWFKGLQAILAIPLTIFVGAVIAALGSAWPSSVFRALIFHQELFPTHPSDHVLLYVLYGLSFGWLLWLTWGLLSFGKIPEKLRSQDQKFLQKFRVIMSGVFLGFALALLTYYI
ncbi:MAG: hypothetical protein NUV91_00360 [Candidatus Omnitrophica bacterium]|nr:hypothetical protein [Candidatus Omnitrophota bacterium]